MSPSFKPISCHISVNILSTSCHVSTLPWKTLMRDIILSTWTLTSSLSDKITTALLSKCRAQSLDYSFLFSNLRFAFYHFISEAFIKRIDPF